MAISLSASFASEPEPVYYQAGNSSPVDTLYSPMYAPPGFQQYPVLPAYNASSLQSALPTSYSTVSQRSQNYGCSTPYQHQPTSWQTSPLTSHSLDHGYHQHAYYPHAVQPVPALSLVPGLTRSIGHDNSSGLGLMYDPNDKHRSQSFVSIGSSNGSLTASEFDTSNSETSRASSPSNSDLTAYGFLNVSGTWSCNFPGCTSKAVFTRGCDLRKHHKRHTKSFFCRFPGCSQACGGGFSSKKDLARHEAKHNPGVVCEWAGCERVFSRVDNMRDHVKRIHQKKAARRASRCA